MGTAWRVRWGSRPAWGMAAAVAAVLTLAACASTLAPVPAGPPASGPGRAGSQSGKIIALNDISTLRTLFNRDSGHPRLILIFSPT